MPENKLIFACPVLVAMLALSGCGGGGGGGGGSPAATLQSILVDATKASEAAEGAEAAAKEALKTAGVAVERLTVVAVQGDSTKAQFNAQAVLDAETTIKDQLQIAKKAFEEAQKAQQAAQNLMGAPDFETFLANIKDRVTRTQGFVNVIAGYLLEDADLAGYVATVKQRDGNRTPEEIGQSVAMAIAGLIGTRSSPDNDLTTPALATRPQNAAPLALTGTSGMTWAEIHRKSGDDDLAVPIDGMTALDISAQFGSPPPAGYTSGDRVNGAYLGIPGFAQCQGTCAVGSGGSVAGKLVGNWIFLPTDANQGYVRKDDGTYALPVDYAEYGHWLDFHTSNGNALRLNLYIGGTSTGTQAGDLSARAADAVNHDGDVARYAGRAAGMSLTRETDGTGANAPDTLKSGAFTADVRLTARFGASPSVSGHMTNFSGGEHVNEAWRVDLETMVLGEGTTVTGIADGGGSPGTWSSDPYAPDGSVRPTGINGVFHAHFSDGHAMGVYATRNEDDSAFD